MTDLLDSGRLRLLAYGVAAVAAIVAGWRERRSASVSDADLWPPFWFLSAIVLASMGVARAVDIGGLLSGVGRDQAVSSGWYDTRRSFQEIMIGSMAAVGIIATVAAIWRATGRRRRYLPAAIIMFGLVCFAAVRIVSLHQVDALLYNRGIAGVRYVALIELSLLASCVVTMFWFPFARRSIGNSTAASSARS